MKPRQMPDGERAMRDETQRDAAWDHEPEIVCFVTESNRIEGINRDPTEAELDECERFLNLELVTVGQLKRFVSVYQPGAVLRNREGLNVRVGNHFPIPGGPGVETDLNLLLDAANCLSRDDYSAYKTHLRYETLHPFTDCNGRSGRMLWAWQMRAFPLGFLHHFYYQTLRYSKR